MSKPKIMLHVCCGPDATIAIERLLLDYQVGVFWFNPNIYPQQEWFQRFEAFEKVLDFFYKKNQIEIFKKNYNHDLFLKKIKGLEKEKEGGLRCLECFQLQLNETAILSKKNNYDFFATSLTTSPHKKIIQINEIGSKIALKYNLEYLPSAFRKQNGYLRSLKLCKKGNIYRQNYCGCEFSQ